MTSLAYNSIDEAVPPHARSASPSAVAPPTSVVHAVQGHMRLDSHDNKIDNGITLSQLLCAGMDDAMEGLVVDDDGGGWHQGRDSSCKNNSSSDNDARGNEEGLEGFTWLLELFFSQASSTHCVRLRRNACSAWP